MWVTSMRVVASDAREVMCFRLCSCMFFINGPVSGRGRLRGTRRGGDAMGIRLVIAG